MCGLHDLQKVLDIQSGDDMVRALFRCRLISRALRPRTLVFQPITTISWDTNSQSQTFDLTTRRFG